MKLVTKKSECKKNTGIAPVTAAIVIKPEGSMSCRINYCSVAHPFQPSMVAYNDQRYEGLSFAKGFSNN